MGSGENAVSPADPVVTVGQQEQRHLEPTSGSPTSNLHDTSDRQEKLVPSPKEKDQRGLVGMSGASIMSQCSSRPWGGPGGGTAGNRLFAPILWMWGIKGGDLRV